MADHRLEQNDDVMDSGEDFHQERNPEDEHTVFIGPKSFMNYVTGVVMQFTTQGADEVTIKARGKFISRAVDVAEVTRKRFLTGQIKIKEIRKIIIPNKKKLPKTLHHLPLTIILLLFIDSVILVFSLIKT